MGAASCRRRRQIQRTAGNHAAATRKRWAAKKSEIRNQKSENRSQKSEIKADVSPDQGQKEKPELNAPASQKSNNIYNLSGNGNRLKIEYYLVAYNIFKRFALPYQVPLALIPQYFGRAYSGVVVAGHREAISA
jgi:hypothetical protein